MDPIVILIIGMVVVVGAILALRLHAFLALIIAALIVAALTPQEAVLEHEAKQRRIEIVGVEWKNSEQPRIVTLKLTKDEATLGTRLLVWQPSLQMNIPGPLQKIDELEVVAFDEETGNAITKEVMEKAAVPYFKFDEEHPYLGDWRYDFDKNTVILQPKQVHEALKIAKQTIGERVAAGFGRTATGIGILIAMAAIIGKCLLDSGAADRIVRSAMRLTGERGAPLAFAGSGFLLGIPVFFDTVFYLMMPLGKATYARTGRNYLLYVLSIVVGATMTHSLVPPTPGPLFVADALHVNLGAMILGGCVVGVVAAAVGLAYAVWANKRWDIPLRDSADETLADLQTQAQRSDDELPSLGLALLPILLPVVLISGTTIVDVTLKAGGEGLASK
jgi:gluconate:H+ symporter, GntP family